MLINFLFLVRNRRERETQERKEEINDVRRRNTMCAEAAYHFLFRIDMLKCHQQMYYSARKLFSLLVKSYDSTCFVTIYECE